MAKMMVFLYIWWTEMSWSKLSHLISESCSEPRESLHLWSKWTFTITESLLDAGYKSSPQSKIRICHSSNNPDWVRIMSPLMILFTSIHYIVAAITTGVKHFHSTGKTMNQYYKQSRRWKKSFPASSMQVFHQLIRLIDLLLPASEFVKFQIGICLWHIFYWFTS